MKTKILLLTIVFIISSALLFGFTLQLPETLLAYQKMQVTLQPESGDPGVASARFYLMQLGGEPVFLELEEAEGLWSGEVPGPYVTGDSIQYFAEIKGADGYVVRIPEQGVLTKEIQTDTTPPELSLVSPIEGILNVREPQVIMLSAEGEEFLEILEFSINGEPVEGVITFGSFVKGVYTPADNNDLHLVATVSDAAGNEGKSEFDFTVEGKVREPFFTSSLDWYAGGEITYEVSGDQSGLEIPGDLFDGIEQSIELDFGAGAAGMVSAGPIRLEATVDLSDSRDLMEYIDPDSSFSSVTDYPYPSALLSDVAEVLRLWNPYAYNYAPEGLWERGRDFDSSNQFLVDFSIFDEVLVYRFGDQTVNFQDQTVKDLALRGSYFQLDIPIISLKAGNGLIDTGLSGTAWPRHFAGLQFGIDIFDYWYFQTNISLISDYQGSYLDIKGDAKADNAVANLYDLVDPDDNTKYLVNPEQNLVLGLGTGFKTPWFNLDAEGGLTLHASDAGSVTDIEAMVSAFGVDASSLSSVTDTIETVQGYFPVFDYFPISLGIAYDALDLSLWGITYGADLTIPSINLTGWYHKTDGSYKSLGASITTGMQQVGGEWDLNLGDWGLVVGYNWDIGNIPNILLNELIPLVEAFGVSLPTMASDIIDGLSETSSIPEVTHEAAVSLKSPSLGALGRLNVDGGFAWEFTDTGDTKTTDYQDAFIFGGGASWKSKTVKLGKFSLGLSAKSDDAFILNRYIDGEENNSTFWEFNAAGAAKVGYDIIGLTLGYERDWGTASDADTVSTVKTALSLKNLWFDSITIGADWDETYTHAGAWDERSIDGKLKLKKSIGAFTTGIELSANYTDNADDADDASSWGAKAWGGIAF